MPGPTADNNSNVGAHPGNGLSIKKDDANMGPAHPTKSPGEPGQVAPMKKSVPLPGPKGSIEGGSEKI